MYEAILKRAAKDRDFRFKVRSTPFPRTVEIQEIKDGADAGTICFVVALAYATLLTNAMGLVVEERVSRLKHIQVVSGIRLSSYWLANFFVDLLKMELTSAVGCLMFLICQPRYKEVMVTFAAFPFATLPMTYVLSFAFSSVSSAQTFTIFTQFFLILCVPGINFFLRMFEQLFGPMEKLNLYMKLFPGNSLGAGMFFNGAQAQLVTLREGFPGWEVDPSPWHYKNIGGDLMGLLLNFVFWSFFLLCIETCPPFRLPDSTIPRSHPLELEVALE